MAGLSTDGRSGGGVASALLVLMEAGTAGARAQQPLLGLAPLRRTVVAAERAGVEAITVVTADLAAVQALLEGTPAVVVPIEASLPSTRYSPLIVLAPDVMPEPGWYHGVLAARDAGEPPRLERGVAAVLPDGELEGARDWFLRTSDHTACPGGAVPGPLEFAGLHVLRGARAVAQAESALLRALVKDTEGFMSRHVERPVSLAITRRLVATGIAPNTMSMVSLAVGVAGALFFLSANAHYQLTGALLFLAHSILDGCDGELARLTFRESRLGAMLDFWSDNLVHAAVFLCITIGWGLAAPAASWVWLMGAAAIGGSLGSAAYVYWHVLHASRGEGPLFTSVSTSGGDRLTRIMDALARRDFIYLVVALAAFGKAAWFVALASVGAPAFLALLLWVGHVEARAARQA